MTPIGSLSVMLAFPRSGPPELSEALGDLQHVLAWNRLNEGVREPERPLIGLPGDHAQAVAVVVELVGAIADRLFVTGVVENGRVLPARALEAVVIADRGQREDPLVGRPL